MRFLVIGDDGGIDVSELNCSVEEVINFLKLEGEDVKQFIDDIEEEMSAIEQLTDLVDRGVLYSNPENTPEEMESRKKLISDTKLFIEEARRCISNDTT